MNTLLVSAGYVPLNSALSRLQQTDADFASFVVQFFHHASPQDLEAYPADLLISLARHAWQASAERKPGGRILLVRAAPETAHGQDILLAVNDDMPFLFDSLMNELNAQGAGIRAAFHPIIAIRRDATGKRMGVGGDGAIRESFICVLMDTVGVTREQDVLTGIGNVLNDVGAAVRDWRAMLARMEESARELKKHPPAGLGADDLAESEAFLFWLLDNHFTFLGCRDYVFEAKGAGGLKPLAESGLGLLSDADRRVIRQGSDRTVLTPEVREFLMQPQPLIITKGAVRSTVHRRVHLDYIGVKRFGPDGALAGERRFVGLFTSAAYHRNPSAIPLLRRKVDSVIARSGLPPQSHSGKALANVLDTYPRDELFQVSADELHDTAMGILHITERPQTRVFLRFDKFDRTVSAQIFMPRERFSAEAVDKASQIIADAFNGHVAASYPQFGDAPIARAYVIIARHAGLRPDVDPVALQERIAASLRSWNDSLGAALASSHLPAARSLARRYGEAFEAAYRDEVDATEAVRDVEIIEGLRQANAKPGTIAIELSQIAGASAQSLGAKLFVASAQAELSTALPVFENFGLRAIEERPYRVSPREADGFFAMIHDYRLALSSPQPLDISQVKARFEEAFKAVWTGEVENDGFNRLVLQAALSAREVSALRAIAKFLRQAGLTYSQAYVEDALARNPDVAGLALRLFTVRFDPGIAPEARAQACDTISARINAALLDVKSLDEDRILRRFVNAVSSMLRTTYYQVGEHGVPHSVIAFKFDSHLLEDLPAPRPLYEIFVYHPRVEGVHLRFGRVARGGLRWSDRREDFRTEVLSLVKAQQVKNAVIVPVGAKGGFFPKQLPLGGTAEEFQAEGIAAYTMFVSSLLDLTDNLVAGEIVPPPNTVRHDGDDPYLVVAADKGTATFSDTANGIATARGFWLGDAFASGGSKGYDHKKMGITARGAWEAVKRHFREMGHDTQAEAFSVIGVGDMSGDVFGNGMLLSEKIKLIAAFDHRHIFLDPEPDLAASLAERQRLFGLPRSSWADYDRALISPGGGVFSRSLKSIPLTAPVKAMTGLGADAVTPQELMRALLKSPADLLWFGGIGTFIKAAHQTHAEAGDRANDAIRVDATEVKAKVIGEGANLGVTQAGRIEFARAGGRINTDAIDNSAGVDTSDHEVNLKILLNAAIAENALTLDARDAVLAELTDSVAAHVLKDNYEQTLALSIAQATAATDFDDAMRMIRELERRGKLNRVVEGLPSDDAARERAQKDEGLTRPELAVLLAYAKLTLFEEVIASDLPDDPAFAPLLGAYFPHAASKRFAAYLPKHRLKREIIGTVLVNRLVNEGGPLFVHRAQQASGAGAPAIVRAYAIANSAFGIDHLRARINALDGRIEAGVQTRMHHEAQSLLQRQTLWMLRNAGHAPPIAETAALYGSGVEALKDTFSTLVSPLEFEWIDAVIRDLREKGVPHDLAEAIGVLPVIACVTDIVRISAEANAPVDAVAGAFFEAGETAGIDRLRAAAAKVGASGHWDRLALQRIGDDLNASQRALASLALRQNGPLGREAKRDEGVAAVKRWTEGSDARLAQARALIQELERSGPFSVAKLMLAVGQLRDLAQG